MIIFLNFSWQDMHNSLFFLEKKSEIWKAFTLFEKWKVNLFFLSLISRVKSEMKMPWNRDREWKVKWKCLEIEIEKWKRKKILENSRETRLSQVTVSCDLMFHVIWRFMTFGVSCDLSDHSNHSHHSLHGNAQSCYRGPVCAQKVAAAADSHRAVLLQELLRS